MVLSGAREHAHTISRAYSELTKNPEYDIIWSNSGGGILEPVNRDTGGRKVIQPLYENIAKHRKQRENISSASPRILDSVPSIEICHDMQV